jgi:hypothetical protein
MAFAFNSQLYNIYMPSSLTNIGSSAFRACSKLTSIIISDSVVTLGDEALLDCIALTRITLPSGLTNIPEGLCANCISLQTVNIPGGITSIGAYAFDDCTAYTSDITIPRGVTFIGEAAFYGFRGSRIYFQGNAPATGGTVFSEDTVTTVYYLPCTIGWDTSFGGRPAVLWNPQIQMVGVQSNEFGFTIVGDSNLRIKVSACTDMANPVWSALQTLRVTTNGMVNFSDSRWTNYPSRFYRLVYP